MQDLIWLFKNGKEKNSGREPGYFLSKRLAALVAIKFLGRVGSLLLLHCNLNSNS